MAAYPNPRARYFKGTLKLNRRLSIPDGVEVRVSVTPVGPRLRRKQNRRSHTYPSGPLSPNRLSRLPGVVALGGDALADSEALYDAA